MPTVQPIDESSSNFACPLLLALRGFPPGVGGSSTLNFNIWSPWPRKDFHIVTRRIDEKKQDANRNADNFSVEFVDSPLLRSERLGNTLNLLSSLVVKKALVKAARRIRTRGIWAVWPPTSFIVGSYWAAKSLGLPLYVHMHDMWDDTTQHSKHFSERWAGAHYEPRILRSARRVFAITEEARQHFKRKWGVDSYVLDHPVADRDFQEAESIPAGPARPVIHFAGRITPVMNQDAVLAFVRSFEYLNRDIDFECYTPNDHSKMQSLGIGGPHVKLAFGSKDDVVKAQRTASLLFLPMSFAGHSPIETATVFSAKLLEYLVSNRPIVVCGPAESWASVDAKRNGWGEVINSTDPVEIARMVRSLLDQPERQTALVAGARAQAQKRLASNVVKKLRGEIARLEAAG